MDREKERLSGYYGSILKNYSKLSTDSDTNVESVKNQRDNESNLLNTTRRIFWWRLQTSDDGGDGTYTTPFIFSETGHSVLGDSVTVSLQRSFFFREKSVLSNSHLVH